MELTEIESDDVQELFHTARYFSATQGLCRWSNKTYLYSAWDPQNKTTKLFLYHLDIKEVVEIEVFYKHLVGVVGGVHPGLFPPTLRLINLLHGNSISEVQKWERSIEWWATNITGRIENYSKHKKPVAVWRRD